MMSPNRFIENTWVENAPLSYAQNFARVITSSKIEKGKQCIIMKIRSSHVLVDRHEEHSLTFR